MNQLSLEATERFDKEFFRRFESGILFDDVKQWCADEIEIAIGEERTKWAFKTADEIAQAYDAGYAEGTKDFDEE